MTESEIWQIIQTGNEISVLRIEVFITITVGVLIISTLSAIKLSKVLLLIMLGTYLIFGYFNFMMLIGEMEILLMGMQQMDLMRSDGQELSLMGQYLADASREPDSRLMVSFLHITFWSVSIGTTAYSIWRYIKRDERRG